MPVWIFVLLYFTSHLNERQTRAHTASVSVSPVERDECGTFQMPVKCSKMLGEWERRFKSAITILLSLQP